VPAKIQKVPASGARTLAHFINACMSGTFKALNFCFQIHELSNFVRTMCKLFSRITFNASGLANQTVTAPNIAMWMSTN
jgi:hypothetical protein